MRGEALKMRDRRRHAFAAKAVERPYEQQVELASPSAGKHCSELLSVLYALTAVLVLGIFTDNFVAHASAPVSELPELVLRVLSFVVGRNPSVDCNSHSHKTSLLYPFN